VLDKQQTQGEMAVCSWVKGKSKGFLTRPFAKRAGKLLNFNRNQLRIMMGLLTGRFHLKGHLQNSFLPTNAPFIKHTKC
jgi:hypothetical protein